MNTKQAAARWEVSEYMVRKICKHLGVSCRNIPEDTTPVYIIDKRYQKDPHRFYIFVLDVIINTHLVLEGIDPDIIATCVEQLRDVGLIVTKHGRPARSLNYRDYMVSANRTEFYDWKTANMKNKISIIAPIVSAGVQAVATVGTMVAGVPHM